MKNQLDNKINSLEYEFQILKDEFDKSKKKKWFKSPSILISTIALIASVIFSIITIKNQQIEQAESKFSNQITFIEENIEKLLDEEKYFQSYLSNENLNVGVKNNLEILWNAKSNLLLDKIFKEYDENTSNNIDPNLLLQLGRNLQLTGRTELAKDVFQKALDQTKNYTTELVANRFLANIYAIPSKFQDSTRSRAFRLKDISISKNKLEGDYAMESISRSYELWANDEFYLLGNLDNSNRLIDSSLYYSDLISKVNVKRKINKDRLNTMSLLFNKGISRYTLKEHWKVRLIEENIYGDARIVQNQNGVFITIKIYNDNVLLYNFNGQGYFVSPNEMSFDLQGSFFQNGNYFNDFGVLKVELKNDSTAFSSYFVMGKKRKEIFFY